MLCMVTSENSVTNNRVFICVAFDREKYALTGRYVASNCNKRKITFIGCNSSMRVAKTSLEVGKYVSPSAVRTMLVNNDD